MTVNTMFFIEIWPEAAALRLNGTKDPRLEILDKKLEELGATLEFADRTSAGKDHHFAIIFSRPADIAIFFDIMLNTPEVTAQSYWGPIRIEERSERPFDSETAQEIMGRKTAQEITNSLADSTPDSPSGIAQVEFQAAKYWLWNACEPIEKGFFPLSRASIARAALERLELGSDFQPH